MDSVKKNYVTGSIGVTPFKTKITTGDHVMYADEPIDKGGMNAGPKAFDFLLSALVSCTCVTIKMYAMRKQWNVEEINVDSEMIRTIESGIQNTTVKLMISFKGDLTGEQIERLLFIGGKCPVHKTLSRAITIDISRN